MNWEGKSLIKLIYSSTLKELLLLSDVDLATMTQEERDCAERTAQKFGSRRLTKRLWDLKRHHKL